MENLAQNRHPISNIMRNRWSPRSIDANRSVEREKILSLLEAARWAPSAYNEQPWRYLVFETSNVPSLEKAQSCLMEGNAWAKKAPLLLISMTKESFTHNKKQNAWAQHDLGLANASLVLQAVELGLVAHQMAGFDPQKARELFGIPADYRPVAMIAIGYVSSEEKTEPRPRHEIEDFAFEKSWGNPLL